MISQKLLIAQNEYKLYPANRVWENIAIDQNITQYFQLAIKTHSTSYKMLVDQKCNAFARTRYFGENETVFIIRV